MTSDQLVSGRDDGRPHRLRGVALVVVAVLVALGVVGARWESQRQLDALLAAAEDAEQVVRDSRTSLGGMVQYSGALLARPDLEPAQRAAIVDSMAVDAQRFPPRMAGPRAEVVQVRPLPWDDDLQRAREAVLARIDAWTAFVAATQERPDTLLLERRVTADARQAAVEALVAAASGRSSDRVERLSGELLRQR